MNHETDVVVVGAGLAGLTTALSAAEQGLSAVVLEKCGRVGGTSAMSGGWFAFSETPDQSERGIDDSDQAFIDDMVRTGEGQVDLTLVRALAAEQHEAYEWLRRRGIRFNVVKLSSGQTVARSHHANIGGVLATIHDELEAAGVRIRLDTAVEALSEEGGAWRVTARHGEDIVHLDARRGVVLASGGFTRSPELIARFAPLQVDAMPYGGEGNTGDGLRMATEAGAGLRDMEFISGTFGSHPETTAAEHELLTAFYMGAIIVNTEGRRFADESVSYKELGAAVLGQPGQLAFEVFDAVVRAASQPGVPLSDIDHLEAKGHVLRDNTVRGLAGQMGVDPDALVATVERYNAGIAAGEDEFGRTGLVNGIGSLLPVTRAPFYAYPAKTLMTSTYCGVTVGVLGDVLRPDGSRIPGLYATGEVVGGFHGTGYVTGSALTKAVVFGRVIARELATH